MRHVPKGMYDQEMQYELTPSMSLKKVNKETDRRSKEETKLYNEEFDPGSG
ncbi:hypothetical protein Barb6XT_02765 [Bacteroidales bacterium Barb6XT]|nr:hypothetical protein Barb6XT_02873 [Bacteroidales bacterium Barb6XT]OAV64575.1 hypothetical protein Barb6XT_02765 [Bacteroidales bacterium Barb6XT]